MSVETAAIIGMIIVALWGIGALTLVLQKLLGHSSLTMTMRYAHLAPDHLMEAIALNPLARLTVG